MRGYSGVFEDESMGDLCLCWEAAGEIEAQENAD